MLNTTEIDEAKIKNDNLSIDPEKKVPVLYKFGSKNLILEDYLLNLDHNVQKYLSSKNWSNEKKEEFKNLYKIYREALLKLLDDKSDYIYTDSFGTIYDSSGTLSGKDIDNNYYNIKDNTLIDKTIYDKLSNYKKKQYKPFNASSEIASYFNWVGNGMAAYKEEVPKNKTADLNTIGFEAWWNNKHNKTNEALDLSPFLDMDKYDKSKKQRPTVGRTNYLITNVDDYLNYIELFKDYDWSKTKFKSYANYVKAMNNFRNNLNASVGWTSKNELDATAAGISSKFYSPYFTTVDNPNLTPEQREIIQQQEAEKEKLENEERIKTQDKTERAKFISELLYNFNQYNFKYVKTHKLDSNKKLVPEFNPISVQLYDPKYTAEHLIPNYNKLFTNEAWDYKGYNDAQTKLFTKIVKGEQFSKAELEQLKTLLSIYLYQYSQHHSYYKDKDDNDCMLIPLYDKNNNQNQYATLVYNVTLGTIYIAPLVEFTDFSIKLYELYLRRKSSPGAYYSFEKGGTLYAQFGIKLIPELDVPVLIKLNHDNKIREAAENKGISYEQEKAGRRIVNGKGNDLEEGSEGFTNSDIMRLISIGGDAASLIASFVPGGNVASSFIGAGSSVTNFVADVKEDGFLLGDLWNLGTNLAMDTLGMIPVFGSGAKGTKIIKSLTKYAPRIIASIGALNTVSNSSLIIDSFEKLMDKSSNLTVNDWRNIVDGINLVVGGGAAINRKITSSKYKTNNKIKDKVAVEMTNKQGETKVLLFDGDDAKKIKESNGSINTINDILSNHNEFKDWKVSTNNKFGIWQGFISNDKKLQIPIKPHMKEGNAKIYTNVYSAFDRTGKPRKGIHAETENDKWFVREDRVQVDEIVTKPKTDTPTNNTPVKRAKQVTKKSKVLKSTLSEDLLKKRNNEERKVVERLLEVRDNINNHMRYTETPRNDDVSISNKTFENTKAWKEFNKKYVKGENVIIPVEGQDPITMTIAELRRKYKLKKGGLILKAEEGATFVSDGSQDDTTGNDNKSNWIESLINFFDNPTITRGFTRMIKNKIVNNKITNIYKNAVKPVYKTAPEISINPYVNTLDNTNQSNKLAADLNYQIQNNLMTSDADKNMGINFEGLVTGLNYKNQTNQINNDAILKAKQYNDLLTQTNKTAKQEAVDYNMLQDQQTAERIASLEGNNLSVNQTGENKYNEHREEEIKTDQKEIKKIVNPQIPGTIEQALEYNLDAIARKFNIVLTNDELAVWNKYKHDKVKYTELTTDEQKRLNKVFGIVGILAKRLNDEMLGLPPSPYAVSRLYYNFLSRVDDEAARRRKELEAAVEEE